MVRRYLGTFERTTRPRQRDVVQFLLRDHGFKRAWTLYFDQLIVKDWTLDAAQMLPVEAAVAWPIPQLATTGTLADWLDVELSQLEWFADLKALNAKRCEIRLHHYRYRVLAKAFGSVRLIEAPKPRLKEMQRRILSEILDRIPVHPAVHGFVRGRSIKSFVTPHTDRCVVLRMDLQDFFPSIPAVRVQALFRTAGYPEHVADLLGGICCNRTPRAAWDAVGTEVDRGPLRAMRSLYARSHLPQGAPSSPALANLCAYRMDCRLDALARSAGAVYTRYADDLAFSGDEDFDRCVSRFSIQVAAIAIEEGFAVHHRKTRMMRQSVRQHLAGLVANAKVNVRRADFDRLKAILTNCARSDPESQNCSRHPDFRAHLKGRVGFVETINAARGQQLRGLFEKIVWPTKE